MFPLLFEIPLFGGIRIYTYGVLVAIAFVSGILWTCREGRLAGIARDRILDLSFYIVLAALVGSRVLYIVIEWERYVSSPLDILQIWEGGLVFYGGLLGALAVSYHYVRKYHFSFLQIADLFSPGIALGHSIGRLGCLAAGCCYGRPAADGSFFSLTFPAVKFSLAPPGVPLYPTQLMESAFALILFGLLVLVRRRKRFAGQVFLVYVILYTLARIVLETFRAADVRGTLFGTMISTSQVISIALVIAALILYRNMRRSV